MIEITKSVRAFYPTDLQNSFFRKGIGVQTFH